MRSLSIAAILERARHERAQVVEITKAPGRPATVTAVAALGADPPPIALLSPEHYLRFVAEVRRGLTIEVEERFAEVCTHVDSPGMPLEPGRARHATWGRLESSGSVAMVMHEVGCNGEERIVLYIGLRSIDEVGAYWGLRQDLCADFARRYDPSDEDLRALWRFLNQRTHVEAAEVEEFALSRGLIAIAGEGMGSQGLVQVEAFDP